MHEGWRNRIRVHAVGLYTGLLLLLIVGFASAADAHRSGCHRWHSCASDTGSYVCGDTGHCSACPDNQYCLAGQPRQGAGEGAQPQQPKKPSEHARSGVPPKDAWACPATQPIKGNFTTYSGEGDFVLLPCRYSLLAVKSGTCSSTNSNKSCWPLTCTSPVASVA